MPENSYKTIFFDLDRTLWDYDANAQASLSKLFEKYGLEKHFDSVDSFIDRYNHHNDLLWESYRKGGIKKMELRGKRFYLTLLDAGINDPSLAELIGEEYMDITPKMSLLAPNTREILIWLTENGIKLYILTNGFLKTQQQKLQNSRIDRYFERVFSSEELGINKPDSRIFHWAVTSLNAKKEHCLMIGDDLAVDVEGALSYGIDAVWFNPGTMATYAAPSYNIGDLLELKKIIGQST